MESKKEVEELMLQRQFQLSEEKVMLLKHKVYLHMKQNNSNHLISKESKYNITKGLKVSSCKSKFLNDYLHSTMGSFFPLKISSIIIGHENNGNPIHHPRRMILSSSVKQSHGLFQRTDMYK